MHSLSVGCSKGLFLYFQSLLGIIYAVLFLYVTLLVTTINSVWPYYIVYNVTEMIKAYYWDVSFILFTPEGGRGSSPNFQKPGSARQNNWNQSDLRLLA